MQVSTFPFDENTHTCLERIRWRTRNSRRRVCQYRPLFLYIDSRHLENKTLEFPWVWDSCERLSCWWSECQALVVFWLLACFLPHFVWKLFQSRREFLYSQYCHWDLHAFSLKQLVLSLPWLFLRCGDACCSPFGLFRWIRECSRQPTKIRTVCARTNVHESTVQVAWMEHAMHNKKQAIILNAYILLT